MSIDKINGTDLTMLYELLEGCCCAPNWIKGMQNERPFADARALLAASEKHFLLLNENDYLIAFAGHPQIGDLSTLATKYANTSKSANQEQAGMSKAEESVIEQMYTLNQQYLQKFGFIFIVCASGRTAQQMLDLIKRRINNERQIELDIAANEQAKITNIRLEKLL